MLKQPGVCYKTAASKEYESQKIWIRRGLLGSKQAGIVCVCVFTIHSSGPLSRAIFPQLLGILAAGWWNSQLISLLESLLGITLQQWELPHPQDYLAPPQGQLRRNVCKRNIRPPWWQTPKGHLNLWAPTGSPFPLPVPAPTPGDRGVHFLESSPKITKVGIQAQIHLTLSSEFPSTLRSPWLWFTKHKDL